MNILRRWMWVGAAGFLFFPGVARAAYSLVMTNGYGDCYSMNLLRDRENYQAYRGICSYRGFSLSGCSTTGEVVMLRMKATPAFGEYNSIVSTSLRWGTTMYFLNDVFRPLCSWVSAGYENWFPFDMSCSVAMYVNSGGFSDAGIAKRMADELAPASLGEGPSPDEQRIMREILAEPQAEPKAFSLVMTNGYGDCYRMNLLRNRENYEAYRGVCSYRGFSLSGCSTTGEVVMLRIKATPSFGEHFSLLSTSLRWGTTMYVLNDVFRPLCSWVMAGYENWYPFDMSCSVAMYINAGGFGAAGLERAQPAAWPAAPARRSGSAKADAGKIRIGALLPLTGDLADSGSSYTSALGKAMAEITNALGTNFELVVANTDADPLYASMQLAALYSNGVQVVIGPESSAECEALLPLTTNGTGMLLLSCAATAVPLAIPNDNLMRLTMDDSNQARELAQRIADDGITHLAVLKRSDIYGEGMGDAFWNEYTNRDGTVFFNEYYPRVTDLFGEVMSNLNAAVAAQVAATGEDRVGVLIVSFDEGVMLLEEAAAFPALNAVRWYGTDGLADNAALLASPAARDVARRTRFVCSLPAASTNAKYAEVASHIRAETGRQKPLTFTVASYDALWLAALALQDTDGTGTVAEVRQAIRARTAAYAGATGPINLNGADDRAGGLYEFLKVSDTNSWDDIHAAVPNAPIALPAAEVTSNRFTARWRTSAGATNHLLFVATGPELAVCLPGYGGKSVGMAGAEALESLTPGMNYYYGVRAANAAGTGGYSDITTVRVWQVAFATNGVPFWWLGRYYDAGNVDTNADGLALGDTDGDGQPAWGEYVAETDPTSARSCLVVRDVASADGGSNLVFCWDSAAARRYTLVRATNLMPAVWSPPLIPWATGTGGMLCCTSPVDLGLPCAFFRLRVEMENP